MMSAPDSRTSSGFIALTVAAVPTAAESNSGYDRTLFKHWVDANGDCQNARAEVLISEREADTPLTYTTSGKCTVSTGRWFSYYDRVSWTLASDVDIDHMVPLAEAWDSGARRWTVGTRRRFANDLRDARSLVAVTASSNRSKSDSDPASGCPTGGRCRYVRECHGCRRRSASSLVLASLGARVMANRLMLLSRQVASISSMPSSGAMAAEASCMSSDRRRISAVSEK